MNLYVLSGVIWICKTVFVWKIDGKQWWKLRIIAHAYGGQWASVNSYHGVSGMQTWADLCIYCVVSTGSRLWCPPRKSLSRHTLIHILSWRNDSDQFWDSLWSIYLAGEMIPPTTVRPLLGVGYPTRSCRSLLRHTLIHILNWRNDSSSYCVVSIGCQLLYCLYKCTHVPVYSVY